MIELIAQFVDSGGLMAYLVLLLIALFFGMVAKFLHFMIKWMIGLNDKDET